MSTYKVTAYFEVDAPPQHTRAVEKLIHGLVQDLVGSCADALPGGPEIVGAHGGSAEELAQ